jgi:archaetidylinositol phosphate synthase
MSQNTWVHRFVRPIVKPLARLGVTPNQVTTVRLLLGLGAAAVVARGDESGRQLGAGLFLLAFLLDRVDGLLARQTGKSSVFGHRYDLASDAACNALIFLGLGIGLRGDELGWWSALLGAVAGLAVVMILWLVLRRENVGGLRAGELGSLAGCDPDDAMIFVPLGIWLEQSWAFLWAAAIGAPLFVIFFMWKLRRRVRGTTASEAGLLS